MFARADINHYGRCNREICSQLSSKQHSRYIGLKRRVHAATLLRRKQVTRTSSPFSVINMLVCNIVVLSSRRTSAETHAPPAARSASSDSSTGSESSTGSGIRNTGAPFTTEEMKQKYLSRTPPTNTSTAVPSVPAVTSTTTRESSNTAAPVPRTPFQSRFLGAGI